MDTPKKVAVQALQLHTHDGQEYQPGARYQVDAEHVDSLVVQGKAAPVDAAAVAPESPTASAPKKVAAKAVTKDAPKAAAVVKPLPAKTPVGTRKKGKG